MIAAPYKQLLWKEYRAIRGFWIALSLLAIGLELLVLAISDNRTWSANFVYNVALAAPVFFALGCIGTAFAVEKEEGTFDWLRASPVTDAQVFWSKLGLCLLATVGMFLVLMPITIWLAPRQMLNRETSFDMFELWLVAAIEVIAWGMLFSLRSARPMAAIVSAIVVGATLTHLTGAVFATSGGFEFAAYVQAVPLRLLIVAPVIVADVVLGLRWLSERESTRGNLLARFRRPSALISASDEDADTLAAQRKRRDRGQILSRLLWQSLRQSWRLMAVLVVAQIAVTLLVLHSDLEMGFLVAIVFVAALMGACVFLPDQERHYFRFFVEHNVPPRVVWLSRVVPWAVVVALSTYACAALTLLSDSGQHLLRDLADRDGQVAWQVFGAAIGGVAGSWLAFAGGQWVSMLVRSGLLSGVLACVLAAVLIAWVTLIVAYRLPLLFFVAPLIVVFPWAAWLRAPDWIVERTTWPARVKAAAAVLVPSALLAAALPPARIAQVSDVSPGFSEAEFIHEITPAALATGELYRRANEIALGKRWLLRRELDAPALRTNAGFTKNVRELEPALSLILEATHRDACCLANPATLDNWPIVDGPNLLNVVLSSGQLLEAEGKLDEALERYFTAFTVKRQLTSHVPNFQPRDEFQGMHEVFVQINYWAAQAGQNSKRLRAAIARLEDLSSDVLNADDSIKANYIIGQRVIAGDERSVPLLFSSRYDAPQIRRLYLNSFLPWEVQREQRLLNHLTAHILHKVGGDARWYVEPGQFDSGLQVASRIASVSRFWEEYRKLFQFQRRAAVIRLACQAYRLRHGQLPQKLEDLVGKPEEGGLLETVPTDPFSDRPFVYFPQGIPQPRTEFEQSEARKGRVVGPYWGERLTPEIPCLWSPGQRLVTGTWRPSGDPSLPEVVFYAWRASVDTGPANSQRIPEYTAWLNGIWLPIPGAPTQE